MLEVNLKIYIQKDLKMNKKIILTSVLFLLILGGAVFAFQENLELEQNKDNSIVVVKNIVYVGEKTLQSPALLSSDKKENFELENIPFASWFSDFINKNIKQQEPKVINVPEDFTTIQGAINSARYGDIVKVAQGEYYENIVSKDGVDLIGTEKFVCIDGESDEEFECIEEEIALGGFSLSQDDGVLYENFIDQKKINTEEEEVKEEKIEEIIEDDEVVEADEIATIKIREKLLSSIINSKNSGNVITFKNNNIGKNEISGFIIKNSGKKLSGIYVENSSPWIHDNIIIDNEFGIYIKGNSFPVIAKNIIQFSSKGVQIYNFEKSEDLAQESETEENQDGSAQEYGINDIKASIVDNLITDNKVGVDVYKSSALINHNTISYNNHYKAYLGATYGINLSDSSAQITNNIVSDSGICELCVGINIDKKSKGVVLKYNNIWNNKNNYVCYGQCTMEDNNFSEEPLFVDYINGDYRFGRDSGLIGKSENGLDIGVRW